jgi:hypothetical protein
MLADIAPRVPGLPLSMWLVLAFCAGVGLFIWVVMRPLRGWKRFAARHGLTLADNRMTGAKDGLSILVELVSTEAAPLTRVTVTGARTFTRESVGRMSEAALEEALSAALLEAKAS